MLSPSLIDQFRLTVLERGLHLHGLHVWQEGQGEVAHRWINEDPDNVWSVSKTVTALGVGMCLDEGRLSLGDRVVDFFPASVTAQAAEGSEEITVRDLLHMAGGKEFSPWFEETDEKTLETTDWVELFFRSPQVSKPGTHFFYANNCTYMLGRIVASLTGGTLRDYLLPRFFYPLGIYNPQWQISPDGHTLAASGLQVTTTQLSRIGRLLLDGGRWEGEQLVSADYVEAMATDTIPQNGHFPDEESNAGYGYQVWRNTVPGTFRADGMYGQFIIVVPEKRAVVTTTSHEEAAAHDIVRYAFRDIIDHL
ncbi:MAG: beta-lactamase family protein [Propionibacteriaceae bacterium]|jgi:CubicO group peptidase (beta-lactamase class C family)|nr:beta-lactamase family protein [Propionibacteriaceae bacterium]